MAELTSPYFGVSVNLILVSQTCELKIISIFKFTSVYDLLLRNVSAVSAASVVGS